MGIGGSGRQSLSKLASYICEYTVFQIEVSKNYKKLEFREGMAFKNNLKTCLLFNFPSFRLEKTL